MPQYRCSAGHVSTLDFEADQLKQPCPVCEITIYKFAGVVDVEEAQRVEVVDDIVEMSPTTKNRRNAAIVAMAGAVLIVFVWVKQTAVNPTPTIDASKVLPVSSAIAAPTPNNLSQVAITNLQADVTGQDSVTATFELVNNGGPTNDYPSLRIHWKDSTTPDLTLSNVSYAHPSGPFTRLKVSTELNKPVDASGVEITLIYE